MNFYGPNTIDHLQSHNKFTITQHKGQLYEKILDITVECLHMREDTDLHNNFTEK